MLFSLTSNYIVSMFLALLVIFDVCYLYSIQNETICRSEGYDNTDCLKFWQDYRSILKEIDWLVLAE